MLLTALAEGDVSDLSKMLMAGMTGLSALFGWLQTNSRGRIKELEREAGVEKSRADKIERRVQLCEDDRKNLRQEITAGQTERMNLSIQLNTALLGLNAAMERANSKR